MKTKYTKDLLTDLVKKSKNMSQVLRELGLNPKGGSFSFIKNKIKTFGIDISHFEPSSFLIEAGKIASDKKKITKEVFIETYLVDGKEAKTAKIKERLFLFGLKENKCEKCPNEGEWQGEKLTLQMHHLNGDNKNNKIENLQILCPNCHSQTENWGKSSGNKKPKKNKCLCGEEKNYYSKMCLTCSRKNLKNKYQG